MGFSRQEYWSSLPFPSPVDHILSELSTMTHPSWVALHSMAHSFTGLDKAVVHVISIISFSVIVVFILSALWRIRIRGLWKLPDGRDWLSGKLGLVLMGRAMFSKSLMEFSVDGRGCVPSLLLDLRSNYGGSNEENGDHLQKVPHTHCPIQCPWQATADPCLCQRLQDIHEQVWVSLLWVTAPFSWVLVCTRFFLCPPRVCFPSPVYVLTALWQG